MRPFTVFLGTTALAAAMPVLHAAPVADWPSYNRTIASERFSPLDAIKPANAGAMKIVCTYDTGESTGFQSGLVQVDGALFATTEHDTFSINPDTCKPNWRMHEDFKNSYLGAQRGVAIDNGRVFRGASNGNVYAYDEKTGARLWHTQIADQEKGETVPAAPIVWNGLVFIGNAGGDNRQSHSALHGPCPLFDAIGQTTEPRMGTGWMMYPVEDAPVYGKPLYSNGWSMAKRYRRDRLSGSAPDAGSRLRSSRT